MLIAEKEVRYTQASSRASPRMSGFLSALAEKSSQQASCFACRCAQYLAVLPEEYAAEVVRVRIATTDSSAHRPFFETPSSTTPVDQTRVVAVLT